MAEKNMKIGQFSNDPIKGWFIINEDGAEVFLKENKEEYIATFKRLRNTPVLSEAYSETAQKIIWKNTDEKNVEQ